MKILSRLRALFQKDAIESEMSEEMRLHLEQRAREHEAAGLSPEEARYAALRQFGGVEQVKEQCRDQRVWTWVEQAMQDLRYAVRSLLKNPGFTATAVLTLALGIGVNAALFAVYDIMALRPLPSREPDELVDIHGRNEQLRGGVDARFSYPDYLDYCAGTQAFAQIVAVREMRVPLPEEASADSESLLESNRGVASMQAVSGNYFSALGAEFVLGRDFLPDEAGPHAGRPVIVVSHQFWQSYLRGDPHVLGRTLTTRNSTGADRTLTIIGVTAPEFVGQSAVPPMGWIPLTINPGALDNRSRHWLLLIGRMRAGISATQAKADLDVIAQRLGQLYPEERRANSVMLLPGMRLFQPELSRGMGLAMTTVLLGFALVLVVACLNVANLLLARGVTRQHEIGVRLVLGAGRGRLVRQLFAENFLLCVLGAGMALLLAMWTLQALKPVLMSMLAGKIEARNYVSMVDIRLDGRIVGFGAIMAVVAGVAAGLAPALHSVRRDGVFALKQDGSAFGRKLSPARLSGLLLVAQVAVCLTMLAVAGIMTAKLLRVRASDSGFATDGVYQVVTSPLSGTRSMWANDPLGAVETLRTLPGAVSACLVSSTPLAQPGNNVRFVEVQVAGAHPEQISYNLVSAGFLETFGVPLLRGRAFTAHEAATGAAVVVVSEATARWLWPGQEAVGQILPVDAAMFERRVGPQAATGAKKSFRDCEVIGVTRDFRSNWSGADEGRMLRTLLFPLPAKGAAGSIFLRLRADSAAMLRGVERASVAAGVPVQFQEKLATVMDRGLGPFRAIAWISGGLTTLAVVLATVGLYGVMSFGVNQRVREIGVRMALGATTERVTGLFVRQGMRLVAMGVMLGLAGGAAFTVLVAKALPGAGFVGDMASNCEVFAAVTTLLISVALLACWLPARRAAKVDPMVALRCE